MISEINRRHVWTGINDLDEEDSFIFQNGEEAKIKAHNVTPVNDDDLFLRWESTEPNNHLEEDYVIIRHRGFYDVKSTAENVHAACELQNPHCHEGICLHEKNKFLTKINNFLSFFHLFCLLTA